MTEQQRQAFEAFAILRAHVNLFITVMDRGSLEDMQEQMQILQSAFATVVALGELQKKAA